jgi:RNA polymerase sigma-70 factor (ECF subfamily)
MLENEEEARDAAQEIVLLMYEHITELRAPEAFNVWLMRIISNTCIGISKKRRRDMNVYSLGEIPLEPEETSKEFIPHEWADSESVKESLRNIVERLPRKRRMAIIMYYYDEMSYRDIAAALNVSINTVSTNIMKAKAMIKEEIEKQGITGSSRFAAVPVLTLALREEQSAIIASGRFAEIKSTVNTALSEAGAKAGTGTSAASHGTANTGVRFATVFIVSVVFVSLAIVALFIGLNGGSADKMTDPVPNLEVVSVDTPSDPESDGQIAEIKLIDMPESTKVTWELVRKSDGQVIASGKGDVVSDPIIALYNAKNDGSYTVAFTYENSKGREIKVNRDFEIDTDGR